MFAKLKKKIEEQGGSVADGEKFNSSANASTPLKGISAIQSSFGDESTADTPLQSPIKQEESLETVGSKEEVLNLLVRRTEQCKKLESKISEYASIIKEKNKTIEKLEGSLEKQQEATDQKIQEQNEQYQLSRAKLSEGFTLALQKKDEEKQTLIDRVKQLEEEKSLQFKREEESDELQGLVAQETAKVKHLLLNTQEELSKVKAELEEKSARLQNTETTTEKCEQELRTAQAKLQELQQTCDMLTEENSSHTQLVGSLSTEKESLQAKIDHLTAQVAEKSSLISSLEEANTELESKQQGMIRNFDLHKNKTTKLLEEKDDHIEKLQERIQMLEQRFQDQNLVGDDRVQALENERSTLEKKLEETRQQLTEIKSTWSDKISHLEQQISHLNQKIIEDSEELAHSQKLTETVRENFTAQVQHLQSKIDDAEKRAEENWQLANKKDQLYEKEKSEIENQLQRVKFEKIDVENNLRAKIDSLESQILSLEDAKEHEKTNSDFKINEIMSLSSEVRVLKDQLEQEKTLLKESQEKVKNQEVVISTMTEEMSRSKNSSKEREEEFSSCSKEKDDLCLRNAELSQELVTVKRDLESQIQRLQSDISEKNKVIEQLQANVSQSQSEISEHVTKLEEYQKLQEQHSDHSSQITDLEQQVTDLQDQVADKNKALKKQEQRLSDLKKTLQRELKVQALPNDQPMNIRSESPLRDQTGATNQAPHQSLQQIHSDGFHNGGTRSRAPPSPNFTSAGNFLPAESNLSPSSPAVLHDISSVQHSAQFQERVQSLQDSIEGRGYIPNSAADMNSLEKDINFQYLKHVVMKFMLSRESEAIHLIRAVSVLLKFSAEEQKLIRETLEWKMSWFGSRPSTGGGQRAKFIPPSF
ncbi:golgin subfamily A member 1-like isoform X2 [Crassostrea angulata]|uniref:golgin subfamily A member 1-like isoform X2 n=1 Tax=Magallana angulata TaxID=2784310 RepID=UPI0022B0B830|nr:golgin subfamily A member 1-like isoform X2 [Crassostrea angulata]